MIEYVDLNHAGELDEFVLQHKNCHFMQSSLWGNVKTDWAWHGLICRDDRGRIRGTMAVLRHDIPSIRTCLLYAPRGPIFHDRDRDVFSELIDGAKALGKRFGAYRLRIDPRISSGNELYEKLLLDMGFQIDRSVDFSLFQPRLCYVLDLRGKTAEQLMTGYHRSCRYNIHKAQRDGVSVRQGAADDIPIFWDMMKETADKNGFEPRDIRYYRAILEQMEGNAKLYLAELEKEPLAAAIVVSYGTGCWLLYSCSYRKGQRYHPNELLQWTAQVDALRAGCCFYDFRGVEGWPLPENPKVGLHQYKQGFGAKFVTYLGQMDLNLRPVMSKAVDIAYKLL